MDPDPALESAINKQREKFTKLLDLARSNPRSKSYSRDIIRANKASEPIIGTDKTHISRHVFSIEDVIACYRESSNSHTKEILRQHKATQRGDRSVVISILEDHVPAWIGYRNLLKIH